MIVGLRSFSDKSLRVSGWDGHLRAKARHDCYVEECLLCGWHPYSTENGKYVLSNSITLNATNSQQDLSVIWSDKFGLWGEKTELTVVFFKCFYEQFVLKCKGRAGKNPL